MHSYYDLSKTVCTTILTTPGIKFLYSMQPAPITQTFSLVAANLSLGNRSDPTDRKVNGDGNYANDPEHSPVICSVISENDSEDDTTQVASCAGASRYDT